jgi:hypothetical protein
VKSSKRFATRTTKSFSHQQYGEGFDKSCGGFGIEAGKPEKLMEDFMEFFWERWFTDGLLGFGTMMMTSRTLILTSMRKRR